MNEEDEKKVVVEIFVTPGPDDRPWIKNIVRAKGLTVTVRRARVTSRDAWLQLDVSGPTAEVDRFIRRRRSQRKVVYADFEKIA